MGVWDQWNRKFMHGWCGFRCLAHVFSQKNMGELFFAHGGIKGREYAERIQQRKFF